MLRLLKKGWMPRICEVPTALPGKIVTVSYSLQSLNALDVSVHRSIIYKMILHHPKECRCRDIIKHGQPISCRAPLPRDTRYQVHSSRVHILVKLSQVVSHRRPLYSQSFIAPQARRRVIVELEHTLPVTRSQPPGVWRVMAYDSSSSAVT